MAKATKKTVPLDTGATAAYFGQDPFLLDAVDKAEGNLLRAVQITVPSAKTREKALQITARSATHAMRDFIRAHGLDGAFVEFWGARWAPVGTANDPTNLNKNWVKNVKKGWGVV